MNYGAAFGEPMNTINPLAVDDIEYVDYATLEPQSYGAALERLGFAAVARHRSREIVLYRAGGVNVIVNADPSVAGSAEEASQAPRLKAFALRVRDAVGGARCEFHREQQRSQQRQRCRDLSRRHFI